MKPRFHTIPTVPRVPLALSSMEAEPQEDPGKEAKRQRAGKRRERTVTVRGRVIRVRGDQDLEVWSDDGSRYRVCARRHPWVRARDGWVLLASVPVGRAITVIGQLLGRTLLASRITPATVADPG